MSSSDFSQLKVLSKTVRGIVSVVREKQSQEIFVLRKSLKTCKSKVVDQSANFAEFWFWKQKFEPVPGLVTIIRKPWIEEGFVYELYEKIYGRDLFVLLENATQKNTLHTMRWKSFVRDCIRQIANTLTELHEEGWAYIDLSLDNVMMDERQMRKKKCNLIDFESTVQINVQNPYICELNGVCKPEYIAPEALHGDNYTCFDPRSCDIWALGVVIVLLISGSYPYSKPSSSDYYFNILINEGFKAWCDAFWSDSSPFDQISSDLLEKIFKKCSVKQYNGWTYYIANNRLTAKQISQHEFCQTQNFSNVQTQKVESQNRFGNLEVNSHINKFPSKIVKKQTKMKNKFIKTTTNNNKQMNNFELSSKKIDSKKNNSNNCNKFHYVKIQSNSNNF